MNFIDTADSYGPYVSEELIREALHPYDGVVVATKAGLVRTGPGAWVPVGLPAYLRQQVEMSLRRLGVDRIDLFQLHRIDPDVPLADQIGELNDLRAEGKIRHIGVSEVTATELEDATKLADIATVQNQYSVANRQSETVLEFAEDRGIGFIPWFPVATGQLARPGGSLDQIAAEHGATPAQLALAWLLRRSPVMLPIPGTKSVAHVEENIAAAEVTLRATDYERLTGAGGS